jgi:hypothetical protein
MNTEGRLRHYQSVVTSPGFPRAVAGVVAELRLARISRDAIAAWAPDLEPLTEAYEAELKQAGLTDWPGVLALASEAASAIEGNKPRLIGLPMLLLDVPIRNEAEFVFVDLLTGAATEALTTVPTADQQLCAAFAIDSARKIDALDQGSVGNESGASGTNASALTNLHRRLFREEERIAKPNGKVEGSLRSGRVEGASRSQGGSYLSLAARFLLTGSPCCVLAGRIPRPPRGGVQPGGHSGSTKPIPPQSAIVS